MSVDRICTGIARHRLPHCHGLHKSHACRFILPLPGVSFMFFNAGHVLGAAMVQIELGGLRLLYTGDYSCEEDRHLMAADAPVEHPPDVLVVESTYGMQARPPPLPLPAGGRRGCTPRYYSPSPPSQVHESREERERKFTSAVLGIVRQGGRCLVPVFAVGRSQELLLILDEFWEAHREELKVGRRWGGRGGVGEGGRRWGGRGGEIGRAHV